MKSISNQEVKLRVYRGHNNYVLTVKDVEKGGGVSATIQDDSYTIREIMDKFTIHGQGIDDNGQGEFQEDVTHDHQDLRQVMAMDLVDRDELLSEATRRATEAQQKLSAFKREAEEKQKAERQDQQDADQDEEPKPDRKAGTPAKRSESKEYRPKREEKSDSDD